MISQAVQDAIKNAVVMGDLSSLYGYFADDVELKMAMAVGSPVTDERCKPSVIECLEKLGDGDLPPDDGAPEFVANGDRIVAFWDETISLRSGIAIRSQCTLVFDVHHGLITRLAIHHDLSPVRASGPERRVRPDAPAARSVMNHGQRNRAAAPHAG